MTTPNDPFAKPPQQPSGQQPGGPPPQHPGYGQQPPQQPGYHTPPPGYQSPPPPPGYAQQPPGYAQPPGHAQGQYPPAPQYGAPGYGAPAYAHPGPGMTPFGAPASMASRLAARVIDVLIVVLPISILATIAAIADASGTLVFLIGVLGVLAFVSYETYFIGIKCATIGKKAMHVRVIDTTTGGPIGAGRAFIRYVILAITGEICTLGYWSPFFDGTKRKQGWHDKVANDFVVATSA